MRYLVCLACLLIAGSALAQTGTPAPAPTPQSAGNAATGTGLRAMGNDGAAVRDILVAPTGALEPPTAADSSKIITTSTALTANTSTTIAAQRSTRIALGIQCGSGGVSISETGAALTSAAVGSGSLFIPASTAPYFTPPIASRTAITAYTATAQTCVVTEYLR